MRLLVDANVSVLAAPVLRAAGHDVVCVADWDRDPGDEAILREALRDQRILVTFDNDFGEMVVRQGKPHAGVLRLVGFRGRQQAYACLDVLQHHGEALLAGALVVVDPGRIRMRPPGPKSGLAGG